jgi:glycyl-tRNA synthetase beta chain
MFSRKAADLLIEVGTEELPPTSLKDLMLAFGASVERLLAENRLGCDALEAHASPRRLTVLARNVLRRQEDRTVALRGPPVHVAFDDDGNPQPAATEFAKKCGVDVEKLSREKTDKGEWLAYRSVEKGRTARDLLQDLLQRALSDLPVSRRMRWGGSDAEFVRPVHWLVLMHGKNVVAASVFGIESGNRSRGHRFMAPGELRISEPSSYLSELEDEGYVLADFGVRRERVMSGVKQAAAEAGGLPVGGDELYDEVTALTEWPVAMIGRFDEEFLELPREVITATLVNHQRYFPVEDRNGILLPVFVTVANLESKNPELVRAGNERVIAPRLADAAFFWKTDQQTKLADRRVALDRVVYQKGLGTLADRSARIAKLAKAICKELGVDAKDAVRAAKLCKCDLQTGMVGEFPELQGIVGSYYAQADGESNEVSLAISEQYLPRFAGDLLPEGPAGQALAIADKLDSLAGIFALGKQPSGNRDPFGLRRAALGVVRILVERKLDLDLQKLISRALKAQPVEHPDRKTLADDLYNFIVERMRSWYLERRSVSAEMFESVRTRRPSSLLDFDYRLVAVSAFVRLESAESLAAANKRIVNILRKEELPRTVRLDPDKLVDAAEIELHAAMRSAEEAIGPLMRKRAYTDALATLAELRAPVDRFFDDVMVMVEDKSLQQNRLALLADLRVLFLDIADISRLSISRD